jgi:uncharacterized protein DUF4389
MSSQAFPVAMIEPHPVRLLVTDDLRRSRLTVALRLPLALPHIVWLVLWSVAAVPVAIVNWFATLIGGTSPEPLHRFLVAYVRYGTQVGAYVNIVADPFPSFVAARGYPVDVDADSPAEQGRLGVAFRLLLAIPALMILNVLQSVLQLVGLFGWVYALATGHMHRGLRDIGVYCLRYQAQTGAYVAVLTSRYPSLSGVA